MKTLFKLSIISASLITLSAQAAPTNAELQKEIQQLKRNDYRLQAQVKSLKSKRTLKKQVKSVKPHYVEPHRVVRNAKIPVSLIAARQSAPILSGRFSHAVAVSTDPFVKGLDIGNPENTLDEQSKINLSLTLLRQRDDMMRYLAKKHESLYRPAIELGGALEGELFSSSGFNTGENPDGINLSKAEIDMAAALGPWVGGFMSLNYNDTPISGGNRSPKSTIYLDQGFVTVGNLNAFPVYFTIGELYVPFGRYSGLQITTALTQSLARTRSPAAVLGFAEGGLYGSLYGYSGTQTSGHNLVFKQGGIDLGYHYNFAGAPENYIDGSVDFFTNIADSQGLQDTEGENDQFLGFAEVTDGNALAHRVPAVDAALKIGYGPWWGLAEFVSATRSFNSTDLSYGGTGATLSGATPKAAHLEVNYTVHVKNRPLTFGAVYGRTWEALAANLPKVSYTADVQTSIWPYTLETFEYRHDVDYGADKSGAGTGSTALAGTGKTRNIYIARLGIYF